MPKENGIRTTESLSEKLNIDAISKSYQRPFNRAIKKTRKRIIRYGLLGINVLLLVAVVGFVMRNPNSGQSSNTGVLNSLSEESAVSPLDQLSSADIAVNLSRMVSMEEALAVTNQADSVNTELAIVSTGEALVHKPQIPATELKSWKDIRKYTVKEGDTVSSLAAKFSVTSDTIRWSNGINGENIAAGKKIFVLPSVSGIIYKVASGDTPENLAKRYRANKEQIIKYNDAEIKGLVVGTRIIIPNATQPVAQSAGGFGGVFVARYGYNGYIPGWCTYYVASRVNIPTNWGNANTWDDRARLSGWIVSPVPVPGAIAQTNYGRQGHVGVVEAVSEDGSMIKYSDMNGLAGFNRVGYSDWVPVHAKFQNFIYR